jgi:hypothetical protein
VPYNSTKSSTGTLDEPRLDGDGDGPYAGAELAAAWLHHLPST